MFTSYVIPEKFLEDDLKGQQLRSQGCLYQYLEKKKLLDGSIAFYPRVIGDTFGTLRERSQENPQHWRWGYNWEEKDPSKPQLSRAIAKTHHRNFNEYGCRVIELTVQEVAQLGFLGFPRRPDYLHASPVCANFSQAHTASSGKGGETSDDLTAAIAVAEAIRQLQPRVFTLENVPRYQNSQSFSIILQVLESEGYFVNYSVVNMSDFGLPQARRRLVLIASISITELDSQ